MISKLISIAFAVLLAFQLNAQITTVPEFPTATKAVTITFNSANDARLGYFTGDLYAHTGVFVDNGSSWEYVIGNWGDNTAQPKLTYKGDGIYELVISPSINEYYGIASGQQVTAMNFVFRSSDGSQQTNDLSVEVHQEGLAVNLTFPAAPTILTQKLHIRSMPLHQLRQV